MYVVERIVDKKIDPKTSITQLTYYRKRALFNQMGRISWEAEYLGAKISFDLLLGIIK